MSNAQTDSPAASLPEGRGRRARTHRRPPPARRGGWKFRQGVKNLVDQRMGIDDIDGFSRQGLRWWFRRPAINVGQSQIVLFRGRWGLAGKTILRTGTFRTRLVRFSPGDRVRPFAGHGRWVHRRIVRWAEKGLLPGSLGHGPLQVRRRTGGKKDGLAIAICRGATRNDTPTIGAVKAPAFLEYDSLLPFWPRKNRSLRKRTSWACSLLGEAKAVASHRTPNFAVRKTGWVESEPHRFQ